LPRHVLYYIHNAAERKAVMKPIEVINTAIKALAVCAIVATTAYSLGLLL